MYMKIDPKYVKNKKKAISEFGIKVTPEIENTIDRFTSEMELDSYCRRLILNHLDSISDRDCDINCRDRNRRKK